MTMTSLSWALAVTAALLLLALIVLGRVLILNRRLHRSNAELEEATHAPDAALGGISPFARRVALIINPTKLESEVVIRLVHSTCSSTGLQSPMIIPSEAEDAGRSAAEQAVERGADVVVAAGGDGTVRAVATALRGTDIALGVVPLGTGNLFARNMGLPYQDLNACVHEAIHGMGHRVDAVELRLRRDEVSPTAAGETVARPLSEGGEQDVEISLVMAGGGLDAEVMSDTHEQLKQRAGWLAYGAAGLRHVAGSRRAVSVGIDDEPPSSHRVRSVLLANCGSLQAGMVLVPSARFDDGVVDTVLFSPRHAWDWAKIFAKTIIRFSAEIPVMTVRQARQVRVTMEEPMPFQIDGDPVGSVTAVHALVHRESLIVNGVTRVSALSAH